jgi:hypothetical protein
LHTIQRDKFTHAGTQCYVIGFCGAKGNFGLKWFAVPINGATTIIIIHPQQDMVVSQRLEKFCPWIILAAGVKCFNDA